MVNEPVKNQQETKTELIIYSIHDLIGEIEFKLDTVLTDVNASELPKKGDTLLEDRLINLMERIKVLNSRIKI